ncbi:MAG: sulfite dehydrogenase [Longimicrobiales bacterium]|nr:sulfite dehydrogenase [Longimicrobiales bacterium]
MSRDDGFTLSRRSWITTASGVIAAGLVRTRSDAIRLDAQEAAPPDPTKVPGRFVSPVGSRAPGERPRRLLLGERLSSSSRTPLADFMGTITPSDLHFERHHAGVPAIRREDHELLVHGMVERPMVFRIADLLRYPRVSRIHFLECSGNGRGAYDPERMPTEITVQALDGLLSTSEWTGVPVSTILREVGVRPGARWVLAEGSDSAVMARSIPLDKMMDDALLAFGQNGEMIRPEQGYPLRLFLPGFEGNTSVKWLRRIEVTDQPTHTREETSKYTDPLGDGTVRQFSLTMDAKSVITFPSYPDLLPEKGWWEIRGLAWSGRGRITGVEVSTDGGRSWTPAQLQGPILPKATVRFRHLFEWKGRDTLLLSRAIDETGYVQPTVQELWRARGRHTSYHQNQQRAWKIARTGEVTFGLGELV